MKTSLDPDIPVAAPIDRCAADTVAERTRFDQEKARRAKINRTAEESLSTQIRQLFIEYMPGCLLANLLEQPENSTVGAHVFLRANNCHFITFANPTLLSRTQLTKCDTRLQKHLLPLRQNRA